MDYLDFDIVPFDIIDKNILPIPPSFQTIYISGGKKTKLNKIDVVGFLLQKGDLEKSDVGLIEVKDFITFVAVKYSKTTALLQTIKDEKIKGKKYKIEIARAVQKTIVEESKSKKFSK